MVKKTLLALVCSVVAISSYASANMADSKDMMEEKCFGVLRPGATADGQESNQPYINLPKGKCELLNNGSLMAPMTTTH